jgi:hypothetical protein
MTTTETINKVEVEIEWDFIRITETIKGDWAEWELEGTGDDGKTYIGSCQASIISPSDNYDEVNNIEEI